MHDDARWIRIQPWKPVRQVLVVRVRIEGDDGDLAATCRSEASHA